MELWVFSVPLRLLSLATIGNVLMGGYFVLSLGAPHKWPCNGILWILVYITCFRRCLRVERLIWLSSLVPLRTIVSIVSLLKWLLLIILLIIILSATKLIWFWRRVFRLNLKAYFLFIFPSSIHWLWVLILPLSLISLILSLKVSLVMLLHRCHFPLILLRISFNSFHFIEKPWYLSIFYIYGRFHLQFDPILFDSGFS